MSSHLKDVWLNRTLRNIVGYCLGTGTFGVEGIPATKVKEHFEAHSTMRHFFETGLEGLVGSGFLASDGELINAGPQWVDDPQQLWDRFETSFPHIGFFQEGDSVRVISKTKHENQIGTIVGSAETTSDMVGLVERYWVGFPGDGSGPHKYDDNDLELVARTTD